MIVDKAVAPGDFFDAADFDVLAFFDNSDEGGGLVEAGEGAGVQPGGAAVEHPHLEFALFEVFLVDRGDFVFAPGGGLDAVGEVHHAVVVEVESRHGVVAFGFGRLFLDGQDTLVGSEFHHAVTFGVLDGGREDHSSVGVGVLAYQFAETGTVENVVAEDEGDLVATNKVFTDDKGLGESVRDGLFGVGEVTAQFRSVSEEALKAREVVGRGDDEYVPDSSQHKDGERVIDHRLVPNRDKLFAHREGDGVKPGAGAAGENDTFHN